MSCHFGLFGLDSFHFAFSVAARGALHQLPVDIANNFDTNSSNSGPSRRRKRRRFLESSNSGPSRRRRRRRLLPASHSGRRLRLTHAAIHTCLDDADEDNEDVATWAPPHQLPVDTANDFGPDSSTSGPSRRRRRRRFLDSSSSGPSRRRRRRRLLPASHSGKRLRLTHAAIHTCLDDADEDNEDVATCRDKLFATRHF